MEAGCAAAVALAVLLLAAPGAAATSATRAQVGELAGRAADGDAAALAALVAVDRVDGQPVDIRAALAGATGRAREARLRALAATAPAPASGSDAREDASRILDERRFQSPDFPRPLHGVFVWIGRRVQDVLDALSSVGERITGSRESAPLAWAAIAAIVLLVAGALASRVARRRAAAEKRRSVDGGRLTPLDPADLERRALEAARRGDHDAAVRLQFRAGLLRLDRRGTIDWRPSLTGAEVAGAVDSRTFDELARTFDEVVYGGRTPGEEEFEASRRGWDEVLR